MLALKAQRRDLSLSSLNKTRQTSRFLTVPTSSVIQPPKRSPIPLKSSGPLKGILGVFGASFRLIYCMIADLPQEQSCTRVNFILLFSHGVVKRRSRCNGYLTGTQTAILYLPGVENQTFSLPADQTNYR